MYRDSRKNEDNKRRRIKREENKDLINKRRRELYKEQKKQVTLNANLCDIERKRQNSKYSKVYYQKNKTHLLRKQKQYRGKKKGLQADDFVMLKNSSVQLIEVFMKEAKKIAPTVSEKGFLLFLQFIVKSLKQDLKDNDNGALTRNKKSILLSDRVNDLKPTYDLSGGLNDKQEITVQPYKDDIVGSALETKSLRVTNTNDVHYDDSENDKDCGYNLLDVSSSEEDEYETETMDTKRNKSDRYTNGELLLRRIESTVIQSEGSFTEMTTERLKARQQNDISQYPPKNVVCRSDVDEFQFEICPDLLPPYSECNTFRLLEQIVWNPISDSKRKRDRKTIRISRKEFDELSAPSWLNDAIIDFMFDYLFRDSCPGDKIYASISSTVYQMIANKKKYSFRRMTEKQNFLNNEMVFWPILINNNHWILVVLVRVLDRGPQSCILYFDPKHKHLSNSSRIQSKGEKERRKVQNELMCWLNYEISSDHHLNEKLYTEKTLPLYYDFSFRGKYNDL